MKKIRDILMFLSIFGLLALVGLSLGSTFISVEKAIIFFNSAPMVVFWAGLVVMLAASVLLWKRIRRSPGLLMLHVGCILIIGGAMWGSRKAHELRAKFFGDTRVYYAEARLFSGDSQNIGFDVKLEKAWTEYYPTVGSPWIFYYERLGPDGIAIRIPFRWEDETTKPLGKVSAPGEIFQGEILEISTDNAFASSGVERFGRAVPPIVAIGVSIADLSGTCFVRGRDDTDITRMALVSFYHSQAEWEKAGSPSLVMQRVQPVRDIKAELSIHDDGKEVMRKTIEVNDPLHYGGYHFYLTKCYPDGRVIITARSDAGLYTVYTGMILLALGVFWVMWGRAIFKWLRQNRANG